MTHIGPFGDILWTSCSVNSTAEVVRSNIRKKKKSAPDIRSIYASAGVQALQPDRLCSTVCKWNNIKPLSVKTKEITAPNWAVILEAGPVTFCLIKMHYYHWDGVRWMSVWGWQRDPRFCLETSERALRNMWNPCIDETACRLSASAWGRKTLWSFSGRFGYNQPQRCSFFGGWGGEGFVSHSLIKTYSQNEGFKGTQGIPG